MKNEDEEKEEEEENEEEERRRRIDVDHLAPSPTKPSTKTLCYHFSSCPSNFLLIYTHQSFITNKRFCFSFYFFIF